MVRSVADRAFLPTKNLLEEVGDMMILTGKTIASALRPPYPYGGEFVSQFLFAIRLCWFPLLVSTVAFGFGAPGLQAANFLKIFGALDRLGGFFVLASIREFAPFVTAIVLAGVAGTAMTADLGARKIREELDALQVLGVDPVKNLVVPRFLALMLATGLFNIYALIFGIFGGILATLTNGAPLGPFWATFFTNASTTDLWGSVLKTTLFGAIIAIVCCYKGMTASGGAEGVGRAVNQAVVIAFLGVFAFNYVFTQTLLATHPDILRDPLSGLAQRPPGLALVLRRDRQVRRPDSRTGLLAARLPLLRRDAAPGRHPDRLLDDRHLGPGVHHRPAVRDRGACFSRSVGTPSNSGVFAAWCDLREVVPYAFGYMMAAKVGTGIVAELGSMRISDEIDALEVMGIDSVLFLCATRLLASWLVLPFVYLAAVGAGFFASYLAVVEQIGEVSSGGYFLIFWMFQNPPDLLYSLIKGMVMATAIVLVGCYYGYNASGGPVGVGTATAKSMVLNIVLVHLIGMLGTQVFWGSNPRAPIGG